ncbi:MAG: DNA polymerase III subunit delta [Anaerolineae bacterium]|nr:DNA polymerase III subunit delta [Anaerolineae bacterium]
MAKTTATTKTVFLLHGDDDFGLEQELSTLRAKMGDADNGDLNTSEFAGEAASVFEVINAVSSYPFLADRRLAIVKGMIGWITRKGAGETGKKAVEQLSEALPNLPDWARLVFVERQTLTESNKLVKLVRELPTGYEKVFNSPSDSTGWILKRAKDMYQAEIEPRAAAALASVIGNDLRRADNELIKLVSYVDGERPINEQDVMLLTPYVADEDVFKMVDALAEGRADEAMRRMHKLLAQKGEDPFKTYGMIIRQFRLLLTAKEFLATGGYPNQMVEALRMNPFVAKKMAQQTRAFSLIQLERIYRALLDYDIRMKTGRIEPALALDLLVASLSGSR